MKSNQLQDCSAAIRVLDEYLLTGDVPRALVGESVARIAASGRSRQVERAGIDLATLGNEADPLQTLVGLRLLLTDLPEAAPESVQRLCIVGRLYRVLAGYIRGASGFPELGDAYYYLIDRCPFTDLYRMVSPVNRWLAMRGISDGDDGAIFGEVEIVAPSIVACDCLRSYWRAVTT